MQETKLCSKCLREIPSDMEHFCACAKSKDGLMSFCKDCKKLQDSLYRQSHKKEIIETNRKYKEKNPDKAKLYSKVYRESHKQKISDYNTEYRRKNKEAINARKRETYIAPSDDKRKQISLVDKENLRIRTHRYEATKKCLPSNFALKDWNDCLESFDFECAYCGNKDNLTKEHFIPVSKGGGFTKENIIPACHRCNCSKSGKSFEDWYITQKCYSEQRKEKIYSYINSLKVRMEIA